MPAVRHMGHGISVKSVSFHYGDGKEVLSNLSFAVGVGELVSVVGPSGCGKSTLLRLLAGLDRPDCGEISFGDQSVTGPSTDRALVFQQGGLFPWLTAEGNVAFALSKTHRGLSRDRCRALAREALDRVELGDAWNRYPAALSGGMVQRVALARAFCTEAPYLLLDEPFGALDPKTRLVLQELLLRLWHEDRKTVLLVTHDIDESILLSDRILFFPPQGEVKAMSVHFARPRRREEVLTSAECCAIRKRLIALFYQWGEAAGEQL